MSVFPGYAAFTGLTVRCCLAALLLAPAAGVSAAQDMDSDGLLARHGVRQGPDGRSFYFAVPSVVPADAKRGDILWMRQRSDVTGDVQAWRMIYVTEGVGGKLTYVGGEIYAPMGAPDADRRVALWNHETAGNQDACAPSWGDAALTPNPRGRTRVPAIAELLRRGYLVVMSDYQGLGTPGGTAYMNGALQAKASLDALRAVRNLPSLRAGRRFVDYGWSQGGQTTFWVASLIRSYAPEFELLGGVPIAPAVDTLGLTRWDIQYPPMGGYLVTTVAGLSVADPDLKLRDILTPKGLETLAAMSEGCFAAHAAMRSTTEPAAYPQALEPGKPWRTAFDRNDDFYANGVTGPLLVFQGEEDKDVPVDLTRTVVARTCRLTGMVDYREIAQRDHSTIVADAAAVVPDWFDARFAGTPVQSTCESAAGPSSR